VHRTAAQMYDVCHEDGHRVRRRRIVRAEAIRLHLVTRIQRASDRSGRPSRGRLRQLASESKRKTKMMGQADRIWSTAV
jgi:hypothetical protein